jgi:hypothetical protein
MVLLVALVVVLVGLVELQLAVLEPLGKDTQVVMQFLQIKVVVVVALGRQETLIALRLVVMVYGLILAAVMFKEAVADKRIRMESLVNPELGGVVRVIQMEPQIQAVAAARTLPVLTLALVVQELLFCVC